MSIRNTVEILLKIGYYFIMGVGEGLQKDIFSILFCDEQESTKEVKEFNSQLVQEGGSPYSTLLYQLSNVKMSEEEAKSAYSAVRQHLSVMEKGLGRKIGFRVALLDYLVNIHPQLECPKFIEIKAYNELLNQTTLDGLTRIYNRRYFENLILKEINRSARYGNFFSILLLDIDDFKQINDTRGHMTGDRVLEDFAALMKDHLRAEDVAARYGGEEFVILLPQTDTEGAKGFGQRLLKKSAHHKYPGGVSVSFSGGVATYPDHGYSRDDLVYLADKGLYASKLEGKNRISVVNDGRRNTLRYKAGGEFFLAPQNREKSAAYMRDISVSGIAGTTMANLESGDTIYLEVRDRDEASTYLLTAQVVWIEKKRTEEMVHFGARYKENHQRAVRRLITQYVPDESSAMKEYPEKS